MLNAQLKGARRTAFNCLHKPKAILLTQRPLLKGRRATHTTQRCGEGIVQIVCEANILFLSTTPTRSVFNASQTLYSQMGSVFALVEISTSKNPQTPPKLRRISILSILITSKPKDSKKAVLSSSLARPSSV